MLLCMQAGQRFSRHWGKHMPTWAQEEQHALLVGHRRHQALLRVGMRLLATRARMRQSDR
jgi:hypothetical protein